MSGRTSIAYSAALPHWGSIFMGFLCMLAATASGAQSLRETIAAARLGSGYAQMLNLATNRDFSASHLDISGESAPTIDIFRLPYESEGIALSDGNKLHWRVAASYLQMKDSFDVSVPGVGDGSISSKWPAYSLSGGLVLKSRLGNGFTLEPGLDIGLARLFNDADYSGTASEFHAVDGLLFNWHTNAWLVTPNLGLSWATKTAAEQKISVRAHTSWSWISSFQESNDIVTFRETAGTYSIRADYTAPTGATLFNRPLDYVLQGGYGGFFGGNRDALGFSSLGEVGGGFEIPLSTATADLKRLRLSASYLYGADVHGWSIGLGMRY